MRLTQRPRNGVQGNLFFLFWVVLHLCNVRTHTCRSMRPFGQFNSQRRCSSRIRTTTKRFHQGFLRSIATCRTVTTRIGLYPRAGTFIARYMVIVHANQTHDLDKCNTPIPQNFSRPEVSVVFLAEWTYIYVPVPVPIGPRMHICHSLA